LNSSESYLINYINLERDGFKYYIPQYAFHRPAVRALISGRLHEPKTHFFVKNFCSKYHGSIIHAGTFFGDMLPNFSTFVNGTVYGFEPVLENYVLAKLSVENNQLSNVVLINSALSEVIGNLRINTTQSDGRHAGGGSYVDTSGVICSSVAIDYLKLNDIILIHLDIEGHELIALKGALETIKKFRPVIAIEDNKNNCKILLQSHCYILLIKIPGLSI